MVGDVAINISVVYQVPGNSSPSSDVTLTYSRDVTIAAGSRNASVTVLIANNGFIKFGAAFKAELKAVKLNSGGTCEI